MNRVVAIIQSRMGSNRLPGKALQMIGTKPMIQHVIERALWIRGVDLVVVAVPDKDLQDYLPVYKAMDLPNTRLRWVRGSERNVWSRYQEAVWAVKAQHVMRITGDCPLLCPWEAERVLRGYWNAGGDKEEDIIATNDTTCSGIPDGCDVEVLHRNWFEPMKLPMSVFDQEHVTTYAKRYGDHRVLMAPQSWPRVKLSVDTEDDLCRVRGIMEQVDKIRDRHASEITPYNLRVTMEAYLRYRYLDTLNEGALA